MLWAPLFRPHDGPPSRMPLLLTRLLLFKLMLMSGVVKIQSQDETWLNLTALVYHFASQCIPTPVAWCPPPPHTHTRMRAASAAASMRSPSLL